MKYLGVFFAAFLFLLPSASFAADSFEVTGWIPYWRSATGTADVLPHLSELSEVNPFVYTLKNDGTIPTKEAFVQTVCAGRPEKGMPSWCQLGLEMDKINNIYSYLKGRADGKIHAGRPYAKPNG